MPGELAVLDPFVGMTQGFWQDNERYLATYWEAIPDVWVHGDLALREDDGTVFLLGRSDDTLMIAGKRVGPSEVEEVATSLAEVEEAAAIGVDDAAKGEALVVFVVLAAGADGAGLREAIIAAVVRDLGRPFAPKEVFVVADLPRTRSGKVMRRVVRSVATGRDAGDLSSLANPEAVEEIRAVVGLPRGAAM
ncbi:AMP-binding enzyme [Acuticoccus sp.]|uniref:AMP-binding enzyme n=1 Tax=Acuticoccus sp. TaxID=1904378 RepID=UPI003B52CD1F